MDRRSFLYRAALLLAGNLIGLNGFQRALASQNGKAPLSSSPTISLIIDDIGYSRCRAREFLELDVPITFSILPRLRYSEELAFEIHRAGHEVMLHQPMEPYAHGLEPGPGALYVGDDRERIARTMEENVSQVPWAAGVNNHMGSRFTESEKEMLEALQVVAARGLFFVDSLTTSRSRGYEAARKLHMPAARRNVFLDNVRDKGEILRRLQMLKRGAMLHGHAIGIGHPFSETVLALRDFKSGLADSPVRLVYVSYLFHG